MEGDLVRCDLGDFHFVVKVEGAPRVSLETAVSWPRFGKGQERSVIVIATGAGAPKEEWSTRISWDPETR